MKHSVRIQTKQGHFQLFADSKGAAEYAASCAMQAGAYRVWVDGILQGGPIDELLADEAAA